METNHTTESIRHRHAYSGDRENDNTPAVLAHLVWEEVKVEAKNLRNGAKKKLINGLSGYAQPDRIMAIMGPSGSGKSAFLDALAGRPSKNVIMTGSVQLNRKKGGTNRRDICYVAQDEYFLGTLSVRETLTFSAHLRFPTKMTNDEINDIVEETIIKMGLQACAETKIGNWHLRGISSGEKKRLSISIEILTQPTVLLLDEPTSGLDSASAFFVIQVLKCIALDGRIVVCSIHQPSSHLFYLFDDLLLLSNGETIYFGDAKMAVKFFAEAGFPCPSRRNPSDHFLRCINSDFDKVAGSSLKSQAPTEIPMSSNSLMYLSTEEIKAKLVEEYRNSEISMNIRKRVRELAHNEQEETVLSKDRASWWKQLCILSHRSFLNMLRDMGYYWLRIVFYVLVSITVGILYLNVGLSNPAIYGRPKCVAFIYGFLICLSVGGLPSFIEEHKASYRERISCHYGEAVFVLSNFLSSFPFLVILSISSGTILHYMVQFHPGFSHYCHFCLSLFCCVSIVETCMMVVALLVPNVLMGIGVGTALIVLMMMVSPVFRGVSDLPKFFWQYPMSYITFAAWAIEGQFKNDMIGLEFDPAVPGDPKLRGEEILLKLYGVQLNYCKWWDLAALFCILTCYKIVLFATLKYKDKASKLLHRLLARSIFRQTPQKDDVNNISVVP